MKKFWILTLLCALAVVVLAGCASNADTLPSPSPAATDMAPSASPSVSTAPSTSPGAEGTPTDAAPNLGADAQGVTTVEDARDASEKLTESLERLTEVEAACVVVTGNLALVGLEFDSQYQGGLDERMQQMVLTRAKAVNNGITRAAVADKAETVGKIEELAESLKEGGSYTSITSQAQEIADTLDVVE